jgi:hypothetical protein
LLWDPGLAAEGCGDPDRQEEEDRPPSNDSGHGAAALDATDDATADPGDKQRPEAEDVEERAEGYEPQLRVAAGEVVADVGADGIVKVEGFRRQTCDDRDDGEEIFCTVADQAGVDEDGEQLSEFRRATEAKIDGRPDQEGKDCSEDEEKDRRSIGGIGLPGDSLLARNGLLIRWEGRQHLLHFGGLVDGVVINSLPANFLLDGEREGRGDNDEDEEGGPPGAVAENVGKRFGWRDEGIDDALALAEGLDGRFGLGNGFRQKGLREIEMQGAALLRIGGIVLRRTAKPKEIWIGGAGVVVCGSLPCCDLT